MLKFYEVMGNGQTELLLEVLKMKMNVYITIFVYRKKDAVSRTMDVRKIGVRQLLRFMALL